jgi:RsmE family RNA methyltransferase
VAHVPHVYLPPPWDGQTIALSQDVRHHLERVLRRSDGASITYTDGVGRRGTGSLAAGAIERGDETIEVPTRSLTIALAAPHRTERARYAVEKLAELGVQRLRWLQTSYGEGSPPGIEKATNWAVSALQQSGGAHLVAIDGPITWGELSPDGCTIVAVRGGESTASLVSAMDHATIVVGPEGGFAEGEIPDDVRRCDLGDRILRSETAAVVAAAIALEAWRHLG